VIKNFVPQPYDGLNPLPSYVGNVRVYTLVATAPGNYNVTLAKLTVGDSVSAGNPLSHALFESFNDHGKQAKVVRTRVSGYDREFVAVKNAMIGAGVEFHPTLPCPCEDILTSLGEWFVTQNSELSGISVMSQKRS